MGLESGGAVLSAFLLVFVAEFGDKSQLVCMTLAARYRPLPVLLGACLSFMLLNLLAVTLGAAAAIWLPRWLVLAVVAVLFLWFGYQSFRQAAEDDDAADVVLSGRSMLLSALLLIFMAEFGDKTQLAVAGLGSAEDPLAVWLGATLALICTTLVGVFAGRVLLRTISLHWMHRGSGVLFVGFGLLALAELITLVA